MVEIEIEGETREVDEEKIGRLVKYEDAVLHTEQEVASPTELTAYETLEKHLPSALMMLYPKPLSGTIIDVDVNEQQSRVTLEYKYLGVVETERLRTDSNKFANLMNYWGLYPHQIMEIPGKKLPIENTGHSYDVVVPENTALWAKFTFKTARWLDRFGLIEKQSQFRRRENSYSLSMRGKETLAVSQFFGFILSLGLLAPFVSEGSLLILVLSIIFLISIVIALVGCGFAVWRGYQFCVDCFSRFARTESWPL